MSVAPDFFAVMSALVARTALLVESGPDEELLPELEVLLLELGVEPAEALKTEVAVEAAPEGIAAFLLGRLLEERLMRDSCLVSRKLASQDRTCHENVALVASSCERTPQTSPHFVFSQRQFRLALLTC